MNSVTLMSGTLTAVGVVGPRRSGVDRRSRMTMATFSVKMTTNGTSEYDTSLTYSNAPYMNTGAVSPG